MWPSSLIATVVSVVLLALPAGAAAQGGATNPLAPGIPTPTPTAPQQTVPTPIIAPTNTTAGSGGLSGSAAVLIGIGAVVVLGGISFFIWRDARRRAPVRQRVAEAGVAGGGSKARPKPRKLSPAERRRRKRGRAR